MRSRQRPDMILLGSVLALLTIGAVMVYSSSAVKGYLQFNDPLHYFKLELMWVGISLVAMIFSMRVDLYFLRKWVKPALYCAIVLLIMVKIPGIGRRVNGADRWIGLGPLSIQPSEVIKLAMIFVMAHLLALDPNKIKFFRRGLLPILGCWGWYQD